ncbi:Gfo/Idh/MocA family oxidoreductase [Leifsonia sp. H3M29-4]|uniref:Gfo/Idh/MocA family oxidoreductase n=1 Tax=Salinibacterium metalliresistens TaxID=3031321 RepID=UPI0023DA47C9|nr:Gfo/Idh/MocA family oxidoreductase [Salinibacterium metalliresistens]MDF1479217.1 Gfo/Idh/MocA family oxidoreductase [Salinibacterium metalliresistens]
MDGPSVDVVYVATEHPMHEEHTLLALDAGKHVVIEKVTSRLGSSMRAHVRGWAKLYVDHVLQADQGADLDFLVGSSGDKVSRESH